MVIIHNHLYNSTCEDRDIVAMLSCVVIMQIVFDSIVSCCCYTTYHRKVDDKFIGAMVEDADAETVWLLRLSKLCAFARCCSCAVLGGKDVEDSDIEGAAKLFTLFFHHSGFLDVVPSDVLAGMLLVRVQQIDALNQAEQEWSMSSRKGTPLGLYNNGTVNPEGINLDVVGTQPLSPQSSLHLGTQSTSSGQQSPLTSTISGQQSPLASNLSMRRGTSYMQSGQFLEGDGRGDIARSAKVQSRRTLSPLDKGDRELMSNICYYAEYALSSYSIFLAFMYPLTCSCRLCLSCLTNYGNHASIIEGDGCCGQHKAAAQYQIRNKKKGELVYGTFKNTVLLSPYCIFLDHEKHTVVLSIRGTMSMEDAALDMKIEPVDISNKMKDWGYTCPDIPYRAFLESAIHIRKHIDNEGTLEKVLGRDGSYPGQYNLIIVGQLFRCWTCDLFNAIERQVSVFRAIVYGAPAVTFDQVSKQKSAKIL